MGKPVIAAHDSVHRFLRSVVRRAWFVATVDALRDAIWVGSIGLLVLAGVHVVARPVPTPVVLLVIAGLAVWTTARIISRRPDLSAAAALADRRLGSDALMTTAVECLPRAPLSGSRAAAVVLDQASQAAEAWAPRLTSMIRTSRRTATTVALIPLFIAIILLTRPGRDSSNGDIAETQDPAIAQTGEAEDTAAALSRLRRELVEDTTFPGQAALTPANEQAPAQPLPGDAQRDRDATATEAAPDGLPAGTASAANDAGELAGDALPGRTDPGYAPAANLAAGRSIDVERQGRAMAITSPGDRPYSDSPPVMPYFTADPLPAAAPDFGDRTTLSVAQAAYAARYLSATGDNDE